MQYWSPLTVTFSPASFLNNYGSMIPTTHKTTPNHRFLWMKRKLLNLFSMLFFPNTAISLAYISIGPEIGLSSEQNWLETEANKERNKVERFLENSSHWATHYNSSNRLDPKNDRLYIHVYARLVEISDNWLTYKQTDSRSYLNQL